MRTRSILPLVAVLALAACGTTGQSSGFDTRETNAIIDADIQRRIAELRFQHGQELVESMTRLAKAGESAAHRIREGLRSDDWLTRASLAWVMGATGDRRYIPDLRDALSDSVPGVRYEVASSLVQLGDSAGFPLLVSGLSDADIKNRYKCFETLRRATGRDFGYRHDAAPDARQVAVARWMGWLESVRASAL